MTAKIFIFNEDCLETVHRIEKANGFVDVVLTSPPYNTGRPSTSDRSRNENESRYDVHLDTMTTAEYCDWCVDIFNNIDKVLKSNGVILWNVSYSSDISINSDGIDCLWTSIADIIKKTNFMIADKITWKKKSALPNNTSRNKLTRICEEVFVFCRKKEYKTFFMHKEVSSTSSKGQIYYKPIYNFIEAKNNDEKCPYNKATYSSELCEKLLSMYAPVNGIVFDPFMGTGTTDIACQHMGLNCVGSEISENQCKWAEDRLAKDMEDSKKKLNK